MEAIIPLWVEGRLVWITGLTKRTTCSDVIASVLNFQSGKSISANEKLQYKVIERWRWMERHLPSRGKILRIWQSWCEERKNVYFLLKRRSPKSESTSRDKKYTKVKMPRSRHGTKTHGKSKMKSDHYIVDKDELKSILSMQQNALLIQKEKLALRESEIEEYETLTHLNRVKKSGENYLQDLYLGSDDHYKEKDLQQGLLSDEAVREATLLYERILEISQRIEKQEHNIRLLSAQIRHSLSVNDTFEESVPGVQSEGDNFVRYLQKTKIRTDCLAALNESQKLAIEHNERTLNEYDKILLQKKNYLDQLQKDMYRADSELNNIQQGTNSYTDEWRSSIIISRDDMVLIDNSSDTGLSSLPSSSEEGSYFYSSERNNYVLDTLV